MAKPKSGSTELELFQVVMLHPFTFGGKQFVKWPSEKHPKATVAETDEGWEVTTAQGFVAKIPKNAAIATYRPVLGKGPRVLKPRAVDLLEA